MPYRSRAPHHSSLLRNVSLSIAGLFCALLVAPADGQGPATLESHDPLASPAPPSRVRISALDDLQRAEEKIVPRLWQRLQAAGDGDEIALIVELYLPRRTAAALQGAEPPDAERARLAAAIEHQFAASAAHLISDLRGLSHVPMVFGRARAGDVEALAALPEVYRVYEDERLEYFRIEGGSLMRSSTLRTSGGATGDGVAVAVVDSGVDASHPELAGRVVVQGDYTGTTGSGAIDDVGHGTAVAGIVAGAQGGMAPQASLWALKVGTAAGVALSSSLAALNDLFARRHDFGGLDAINLSWGSRGPYPADCDAVTPFNLVLGNLFAAGIPVFVASGNNGDGNGIGAPACHSKVIAVGAVYDANIGAAAFRDCADLATAADTVACYSDSGQPLDVLAPAHCSRTPRPGGGYDTCFGGTSAAAPYAAGVGAQLLQLHPGLGPAQLRTVLMTSGKPIGGRNGITRSRIDAMAAHQALGGGGSSGFCVEDATTACLLDGRFAATVRYRAGFDDLPADTTALRKPVSGFANPSFETVFFYFNSTDNVEVLLKMLDQGNVDSEGQPTIAVLLGSATPLRTEITIVDTETGAARTYVTPFGTMQGATDFTAFPK